MSCEPFFCEVDQRRRDGEERGGGWTHASAPGSWWRGRAPTPAARPCPTPLPSWKELKHPGRSQLHWGRGQSGSFLPFRFLTLNWLQKTWKQLKASTGISDISNYRCKWLVCCISRVVSCFLRCGGQQERRPDFHVGVKQELPRRPKPGGLLRSSGSDPVVVWTGPQHRPGVKLLTSAPSGIQYFRALVLCLVYLLSGRSDPLDTDGPVPVVHCTSGGPMKLLHL